jgi:hypothetical protein
MDEIEREDIDMLIGSLHGIRAECSKFCDLIYILTLHEVGRNTEVNRAMENFKRIYNPLCLE